MHDTVLNKCILRTTQSCWTLTCAYNQVQLTFISELFDVDDTLPKPAFGDPSDGCKPVWSNDQWEWNAAVGTCDMEIGAGSFPTESGDEKQFDKKVQNLK